YKNYLTSVTPLSQKITRDKEEIPEVNAKPENLVLDLIKNVYREILSREGLERNERPTYELYQKSAEISHDDEATGMSDLGQYYRDSPEVEKSKVIKEKNELGKLWNLAKTDSVYCEIHVENDKIGDGRKKETIYFDRLEGLEYNCKGGGTDFNSSKGPELDDEEIVSASKPEKSCYEHREGRVKVNDKSDKKVPLEQGIRLTVTEVLDAYYDLDETVEEPFDDAVFSFNKGQENELEVLLKEVSTEYDALVNKAQTKSDQETFKERSVEEWREDRYGRPLDGDALGHAYNLWMRKQGIIDEACRWCLRSTKKANSAGKFNPGKRNDGERVNVTETSDNKINNPLFDPGGS
ncbi:41549_t:CDS:2, partial [Gigaspora margarita]